MIQLLIIGCLSILVASHRSFATFQITKKLTSDPTRTSLGKLLLSFHQPYKTIQPQIQTYLDQLITSQDFQSGSQAILQFSCIQTDLPEYKDKVYVTSVDEISQQMHGQKISIILGPQSDSVVINAINYVQTRDRVGEIYAEIVETKIKDDQIFKYGYAPKKSEAEEETFFSKYKWPLIIGGVVIYTMMTANPQAAAGAAGGNAAAR